jgi:formate dehydrogenase subunit delta
MSSLEKLIMMANQIAANQMREPDPVAATTNHIRLYWDPRMKAQIAEHRDGLNETAAAAIAALEAK